MPAISIAMASSSQTAPPQGGFDRGSSGDPRPDDLSLELNLIRGGAICYRYEGRQTWVERDHLVVFTSLTTRPRIRTPDADVMRLALPIGHMLGDSAVAAIVCRLIAEASLLKEKCEAGERETFAQWILELGSGDPYKQRTAAIEIEARLLRLAVRQGLSRAKPRPVPDSIKDMLSFLDRNFQEESAAEDAADEVGLPSRKARLLFRRYCGTSVPGWLQRLRLHHAERQLTTTDHTVLRIALDAGFGSLPRFYAAFKATFGVAPGGYRRRLQEGNA